MAIRYKYTGDGGGYLPGIPARDLDDDDLAALTDEQRALIEAHVADTGATYEDPDEGERVRASRIYEAVAEGKPEPTPAEQE